jgi:tight adherence protein B
MTVGLRFRSRKLKTLPGFWIRPMGLWEMLLSAMAGIAFAATVAYVFYADLRFVLASMPFGLLAIPLRNRQRLQRRRERFILQFKDMLYYLSVSLSAGKSLETSLSDAAAALVSQYGRGETELLTELAGINSRLGLREPVEGLLSELAEKTGMEDVRSFSDVVAVCRRSGGNLVEVMQHTVRILREKMEIGREMETAWASKRLEQRILCVSPVFLVLLIRLGSGDFMEPMYNTATGRVIMTVALGLVAAGFAIGERIMRVRI